MKLSVLIAMLLGAGFAASAQTNDSANSRELSLEDCVQLALQHNLDLQIDRITPKVAAYALNLAYAGYDPSLFLSGQHDHAESGSKLLGGGFFIAGSTSDDNNFNSSLGGLLPWGMTYSLQGGAVDTYGSSGNPPTGFENTSGSAQATLSQPLLKNAWIDTPRLNIRIAKNRLKYSQLTLQSQIMSTATSVEQAYCDLIYNRENVLVQEKAVELAKALVDENNARVHFGALAPLDAQQAEAQAASSEAALISARAALGTQERALKFLITDKFSEWQALDLVPSARLNAVPQPLNLQDSWTKGLTQRPDLLQAKLDMERMGIQLKYDRNQLYPELDVFGTYGYNGTGKEFSGALYDIQQRDQNFYTYGGRITIPLGNISARNALKSDRVTSQQLVLTLKKLEQNIMIQIDNDIGTVKANYEQVQATKTAREYEEQALSAEQKKLENGKSTTYTVLQVQRDLTSARGAEIQALDNYNKSLSQLSLDEGSTLERLNINLDVK